MTKIIAITFLVVALLAATSFSVINAHNVHLNYYVGSLDVPLSFVIILSSIVGALIGAMSTTRSIISKRFEIAKLRRAVRISEKEITTLRSVPLKEI